MRRAPHLQPPPPCPLAVNGQLQLATFEAWLIRRVFG